MIQIMLIGIGLFLLLRGRIKVTDTKVLARPKSIYLGVIIIAYGLAVFLLPQELLYYAIFFASLLAIASFFVLKAEHVESVQASKKSSDTKRNLLILLAFIALVALGAYLWWNFA